MSGRMSAYDRVFSAVFPPASDIDLPTPATTPVLDSGDFGESASSFTTETTPVTGADEQIKWDRAWHIATTYLSLPSGPITAANASQMLEASKETWLKSYTRGVSRAVEYVVSEDSYGHQLRRHLKKDDLVKWYFEEIGTRHYVECVKPSLIKAFHREDNSNGLFEVVKILRSTQAIYLYPLRSRILQLLPNKAEEELLRIKNNFHGLFAYSLTLEGLFQHLSNFFKKQASVILPVHQAPNTSDECFSIEEERRKTLQFIESLNDVGLGGAKAQRVFAEVMSDTLTDHVKSAHAGNWASPSTIADQLLPWVENHFARFAVEVLSCLKDETVGAADPLTEVTLADVQRWQEMGIKKLGALRTSELFDIVVEWDNDSRGAIEDLKRYITNVSSRMHLTNSFSNALSHRLLQPGASTTSILQMYISLIRAFAVLDPKGVLLDRVARPVRQYLRDRNDTVTIVVGGLLADLEDQSSAADVLFELAVEMNKTVILTGEEEIDDAELDWDDMSWMPDPVDAGPEYRKSKNSDIIGALISLFDSKDMFVKEFQNILGERLLKREYNFDKEVRVLELLKMRFGEGLLQSCEVMLRDILDSRRVNAVIRNDQELNLTGKSQPLPELHTRILSHMFWPSLRSESFSIPPEIESSQSLYSTGFEKLKQSRKLTWLHALGQVTVEIDLEDRQIIEEVQTWQACIIYAFQTPSPDLFNPVTKSVRELMQELSMSQSLVCNALTFWVGKLVLKEISPSVFSVLETLSGSEMGKDGTTQSTIAAAADAASTATAAPAVLSDEGASKESMALFWQYSVAMLTNQGPMPLQQIVTYLGMFVPGGCPFGNETMKEFLDEMVREGKLEFVGGNYKIVQ